VLPLDHFERNAQVAQDGHRKIVRQGDGSVLRTQDGRRWEIDVWARLGRFKGCVGDLFSRRGKPPVLRRIMGT
jgi:hypothetical protein